MGAWSHEPFGNDTACDWSYDLLEKKNLSPVEQAIDAVLEEADYLDADASSEALAAIEVLAKLLGRGTQTDSYTEDIDAWVSSAGVKPAAVLLQKAQQAIDKILGPESELKELWDEGEDGELWRASMLHLRGLMHV
jgi:hypothetical protein